MLISNIHDRELGAPLERCEPLIDGLASCDDHVWPDRDWPTMRLAPGLEVGAPGGHGPIRYFVEQHEPGRRVRFRFTAPDGFDGHHEFTLDAVGPATTMIRHECRLRLRRTAWLTWPLLFRPLHDALIEDALDKAEAWLAGATPPPAAWTRHVRVLRSLLSRRRGKPAPRRGSVAGGPTRAGLLDPSLLSVQASYVDRFTLATEVQASAREWAKAMFEGLLDRSGRELVFCRLLGLDIGPDGDPGAVSGWRIETEESARIRVAARGGGARGNLVVETAPGSVSLTTALEFTSPWRSAVWRVLSRVHRREAAPTLRGGAALLEGCSGQQTEPDRATGVS